MIQPSVLDTKNPVPRVFTTVSFIYACKRQAQYFAGSRRICSSSLWALFVQWFAFQELLKSIVFKWVKWMFGCISSHARGIPLFSASQQSCALLSLLISPDRTAVLWKRDCERLKGGCEGVTEGLTCPENPFWLLWSFSRKGENNRKEEIWEDNIYDTEKWQKGSGVRVTGSKGLRRSWRDYEQSTPTALSTS